MNDVTEIQSLHSIPRSETLSRQAYGAVRKAIRDGVIVPGMFYSELGIAQLLGISRTPVREALIELSREGLVDKLPQRGFRLRSISAHEKREVYEIRGVLESHLARRLAAEASETDIGDLRRILARQARAKNNASAFLDIDEEFHLALAGLLGFARTREMLLTLRGIIWVAGLAAIARPQRTAKVLAEHRALLNRIAARDSAGAARAVLNHIHNTAEAAMADWDKRRQPIGTGNPVRRMRRPHG